mmetsp:Transcript_27210/g.45513  ORF Transcript_27210/g.45513 Transcript_27210/m.45513 type:complete len:236 (+) Transcript_27210:368-1075(+)
MESNGNILSSTGWDGKAPAIGMGRNLAIRYKQERDGPPNNWPPFDRHANFKDEHRAPTALVGDIGPLRRFLPTAASGTRPLLTRSLVKGHSTLATHEYTNQKGVYMFGLETKCPAIVQNGTPGLGLYFCLHSSQRPSTSYQSGRNSALMMGPQVSSLRRSAPSWAFGARSHPSQVRKEYIKSCKPNSEASLFSLLLGTSKTQPLPKDREFYNDKVQKQITPKCQAGAPKLPKLFT